MEAEDGKESGSDEREVAAAEAEQEEARQRRLYKCNTV